MAFFIDPRAGDAEDDASSTKQRALLAIAGTMLTEISFSKLAISWILSIALPALVLGISVPLSSAWLSKISDRAALAYSGIGSLLLLGLVALVGWFGLRPFLRFAESSFWALNSIAVQPGYALVREGLRHVTEQIFLAKSDETVRARVRAWISLAAGVLSCLLAGLVMLAAWPYTRWTATLVELASPMEWTGATIANSIFLIAAYFAAASLAWGFSDTAMAQPEGLKSFGIPTPGAKQWRIVHLSDIHLVGEPYGFRIESGRAGPRGNGRFVALMEKLTQLDAEKHIDLILLTGDMTDAGRSSEWAAFFDIIAGFPTLADRLLILPGNHDVNVVDRANPARLEMSFSPKKTLRQLRMLSAMAHVQGERTRVFDHSERRLGASLNETLEAHRAAIVAFSDRISLSGARRLAKLWIDCFPLVIPPETPDGLGTVLLNSNAEANFSFTNALGLITAEDMIALNWLFKTYPEARWLVGLHHHLVEYPMPAKTFSERIGTSLINGAWFVRQLRRASRRLVLMHGHRHIDWIGHCGDLKIISAPSPVMEALNLEPTSFLIHTLYTGPDGELGLARPERIILPGEVEAPVA